MLHSQIFSTGYSVHFRPGPHVSGASGLHRRRQALPSQMEPVGQGVLLLQGTTHSIQMAFLLADEFILMQR
jgi:hypothetical protein